MPKFVVYEVWTRSKVVEAEDYDAAITDNDPIPEEGFSLCNWFAVPVDDDIVNRPCLVKQRMAQCGDGHPECNSADTSSADIPQ